LEHGGKGRINPARITIGDIVSKWSKVEKRHMSGWLVVGIDCNNVTVQNPTGGGRCTVPMAELEYERPAA
jgi:hypothetical protein